MINQLKKTTIRVASSYGRMDISAITYYLGLKNKFLISSLNSVTSTAIIAMERFMSSIMDSYISKILPHTQLNGQKKSLSLFLNSSFIYLYRLPIFITCLVISALYHKKINLGDYNK